MLVNLHIISIDKITLTFIKMIISSCSEPRWHKLLHFLVTKIFKFTS